LAIILSKNVFVVAHFPHSRSQIEPVHMAVATCSLFSYCVPVGNLRNQILKSQGLIDVYGQPFSFLSLEIKGLMRMVERRDVSLA
jgi:hypothetical protein